MFDHIRSNIVAAGRDVVESARGVGEILHAEADFWTGRATFGETLRREGHALGRVVSGATGAVLRANLAAAEAVLPPLTFVEDAAGLNSSEYLKTRGNTRETTDNQADQDDRNRSCPVRQEEKERPDDRVHHVVHGDNLWNIVRDDYRKNHSGETDNGVILRRTNQLRERYGRLIHPGDRIELPDWKEP